MGVGREEGRSDQFTIAMDQMHQVTFTLKEASSNNGLFPRVSKEFPPTFCESLKSIIRV